MKHFTVFALFTLFFTFLIGQPAQAQFTVQHQGSVRAVPYPAKALPMKWQDRERTISHAIPGAEVPSLPLNADMVVPSGFDTLPIVGSFPFQSDGRPLHNVQVDPSNPMNIHVIVTDTKDPSAADTSKLLTRRCFYTFSSDGGLTWKAPVTFSTVRTGYADMHLFLRNGKYVPIIAAHRVISTNASSAEVGVWIEQGNPGDGNFSESLAPRVTAAGLANSDILWPTVAMSPTNDTAYVVATVNPASGSPDDQLQFGRFILNQVQTAATFDGTQWDATPGSGDPNNPLAGMCGPGGAARIRVAPSGKIGVAWDNSNDAGDDDGVYFAESTDGGNTWPTTLQAVYAPSAQNADNNGAFPGPIWTNIDFWYNGENPKFLFNVGAILLGQGKYYPGTASIFFANPGMNQFINVVSPYYSNAMDRAAFEQTVTYSIGSTVRYQEPMISYPTVALTADSNIFSVFYQTAAMGDTELINNPSDPTQDTSFLYGSIYYQTTLDGGATWSHATALLSADATTPKLDYRQPMTSDFNPLGANGATYKVVAVADTAPGIVNPNGTWGFDLHQYGMATVAVSAVSSQPNSPLSISLSSAYPNPFTTSANIQYTLPGTSTVLLTITDQLGRTVKTLVNERLGAGMHEAVFNAADLPNGVYRCTLEAGGQSVTKSVTLLR